MVHYASPSSITHYLYCSSPKIHLKHQNSIPKRLRCIVTLIQVDQPLNEELCGSLFGRTMGNALTSGSDGFSAHVCFAGPIKVCSRVSTAAFGTKQLKAGISRNQAISSAVPTPHALTFRRCSSCSSAKSTAQLGHTYLAES
jgi:hypothetical protein